MVNIEKHISHWQNGADEDLEVANQLIESKKIRHGLFFLHLALEKMLKAHVCRSTKDIAPRLHNLVRLAELSDISFEQEQLDFLAEMNPFNMEERYPEMWGETPSQKETATMQQKTKGSIVNNFGVSGIAIPETCCPNRKVKNERTLRKYLNG